MKRTLAKASFIIILVFATTCIWAQPGGGGGQPGGGSPPGGTGAPIDGGAIGLLGAIAIYSYRQYKQKA